MKYTFGSLFAGIGGIDLGLERAGWECKWQVEIDKFCLKVLNKHWPNVPKYGDIKLIKELPYVDLICGGFPCQPISVAGKRKAQADERWLWSEFARIISMVRPRFVLVENVPNLLNINGGTAMQEVLGSLAESGYNAEWDCLPAAAFGAPHLRYRIFIIAYASSPRSRLEIREYGNEGRKPPEVRGTSLQQNIKETPQLDIKTSDKIVVYSESWKDNERRTGNLAETTTRRKSGNTTISISSQDVVNTKYSGQFASERQRESTEMEQRTGRTQKSKSSIELEGSNSRPLIPTDVSYPKCFRFDKSNGELRGTKEEGRLFKSQGYNWWAVEPDVGRVANGIPARVDRLRVLGNAVVPQVAEWIGRRIIDAGYDDRE